MPRLLLSAQLRHKAFVLENHRPNMILEVFGGVDRAFNTSLHLDLRAYVFHVPGQMHLHSTLRSNSSTVSGERPSRNLQSNVIKSQRNATFHN